ncbi:MAG: hypothetical protein Kow0092_34170 [Deferrisomatales bacterium]
MPELFDLLVLSIRELPPFGLRAAGLGRAGAWAGLLLAVFVFGARADEKGVLGGTRTWSGVVRVAEDLWVPPGATLVIAPGTRVLFAPALSTKTDPLFWSPGTELAVGGRLEVRGRPGAPVVFEGEGPWGGLVAAPGARVHLAHARVLGADAGLTCVGAVCELSATTFEGGDYGLVTGPGARLVAEDVAVRGARVGVYDARGGDGETAGVEIEAPGDAARLTLHAPAREAVPLEGEIAREPRAEFLGEYTVGQHETWRGEVVIAGRVTVVPGAVLTLTPGTRVAFRRIDTNGDGLGEGEMLVLGGIRSLGEPGRPVVFQSAEAAPSPGDWDKVSLIAAEDPDNLFRYTVFRHGVQALHAHFSRFRAERCYFEANLRATQFQESEQAELEGCVYLGNKQALRFRDSRVRVAKSVFLDNLYAVHAFRCDLEFVGNVVEGTALGGVLAKESRVTLRGNRFVGNRDGARLKDPDSTARIEGNRFEDSAEDGLSLSRVEASVMGNLFDDSGLDLVSLEEAVATFRENIFGGSQRHALHLNGSIGVDARENYWVGGDPRRRVYDQQDDPERGYVDTSDLLRERPLLDAPKKEW